MVVVIIGVLAGLRRPRFLQSVERVKLLKLSRSCHRSRPARERYQARQGTYATAITMLDIQAASPKYFTVGTFAAGSTASLEDSWTLTLTRSGPSAGYGAYLVVYTDQGFDTANSTIPDAINPLSSSSS